MRKEPHWLDHPTHRRGLWRAFLAVLLVTVVLEWAIDLHPHFALDGVFGFHAWYGFLTCAAMVGAARLLALLLKRNDTYYDTDDEP